MSKRTLTSFIQALVLLLVLVIPTIALGAAWSVKTPTPTPRSAIMAEAVGGLIYAGQGASPGGSTNGRFDRYDPATDTWVQRAQVRDTYGRASTVVGGKIYAFGGVDHGGPLANVEVYDPITDTWTARASMPTPRAHGAAAAVDEKIYVMGGSPVFGANPETTANEVYDPTTDTWEARKPMPRSRKSHSIAAVGGKIYVFGGNNGTGGTVFDIVDVYDPSINSWTTLVNPMPRARNGAGIAVVGGKILLLGGGNPTEGVLAAVDEYDPVLDHWAAREPMPTPRTALAAAVVGGIVYAIAGENATGYLSVVEAYGPAKDKTRRPDHFLCYEAETAPGTPGFEERSVTLTDQFGTETVEVKTPVSLCTPATIAFGAPVNACGLNSPANEFGSSIAPDGLTMFFESTRLDGTSHIFIATRSNLNSCFDTPSLLPNVNSGFSDVDPEISSDLLTLYFASTRASGGPIQELFEATRPSTASDFGTPRYMSELNLPPFQTTGPSISSDGLTLFFFSDRPGGSGGRDIWMSTRPNTSSPFDNPVPLSAVNSPFDDEEPEISADGLALFFASNRPGGGGDFDIWIATRPNASSPFGPPVNLAQVNSPFGEAKPNNSASGDTLYFQSNRPGGLGGSDIWVATFLAPRASTHLKGYKIKPGLAPVPHPHILVKNQFHPAGLFVTTFKPDRLLLPTAKSLTGPVDPPGPTTVDHYKCYKVKVTPGTAKFQPILGVSVKDQFTPQPKLFDLKRPTRLCTPVLDKEHPPGTHTVAKDPDTHLLCYEAKPADGQPPHQPRTGIHVNNQFGPEQVDTIEEEELCVPSSKKP